MSICTDRWRCWTPATPLLRSILQQIFWEIGSPCRSAGCPSVMYFVMTRMQVVASNEGRLESISFQRDVDFSRMKSRRRSFDGYLSIVYPREGCSVQWRIFRSVDRNAIQVWRSICRRRLPNLQKQIVVILKKCLRHGGRIFIKFHSNEPHAHRWFYIEKSVPPRGNAYIVCYSVYSIPQRKREMGILPLTAWTCLRLLAPAGCPASRYRQVVFSVDRW